MERWDLGAAIRAWRDRLDPAVVGVSAGARRRARGLRREELAGLAGISVDYLTRLEQGRATAPSMQVVEALARALRLVDDERELLLRLAGLQRPEAGEVPRRIAPSVQRLLDRLDGTSVVVYDATWTLLVANPAYDALMGDTTRWRGIERNAVWRHLVGPRSRAVTTPEEHAALEARLVADLRMTAARYPDDRSVPALVGRLATESDRFAQLWSSTALVDEGPPSRRKVIEHPEVGGIALDCDTLVVADDDLRVMVYTAVPGSEDAARLALTAVLGTQRLV